MKLQFLEKTTKTVYVKNLKTFLIAKKMTQAALAKKFKLSTGYISEISTMKKPLPLVIKTYLESL